MELFVNVYAYALLALTHAEGAAKLNLIAYVMLRNKSLKLLNYLTRSLYVAGATDTYCNFKHCFSPFFYSFSAALNHGGSYKLDLYNVLPRKAYTPTIVP